ncbi:MAG TPA: hypothetical protein VK085_02035 [Pseudogracilibacillus sp.]|nr:hypothetical protein [Pseudogracilibacillus sp.]
MRRKKWIVVLVVIVAILTSCQPFQSLSPDKIVEKALLASEEPAISYYGEMTIKESGMNDDGKIDEATIKEWHDGTRNRSEIISDQSEVVMISSNNKIQLYIVSDEVVYESTGENFEEFSQNPKEQLNNLLASLRDTHDIETVGEETITDRVTHHMKATVRDGVKSIVGDLELWIDKEYWIPLKTKTKSGQMEMELEYVEIEFNPSFTDSIFELDIPEDVVIINNDDPIVSKEISQNEIEKVFNKPVYIIGETDEWKIDSISLIDESDDANFKLLEIDYKYNSLPSLSLTITNHEKADESLEDEMTDLFGDVIETVPIRKSEAIVIDTLEIRMLSWWENGLEYTINLLDPTIEIEKLLTLAEKMIEIK